jgi:hypothetical protein
VVEVTAEPGSGQACGAFLHRYTLERMPRWTLEDLIDFEQAIAPGERISAETKAEVAAAVEGLDGAAARRQGLGIWLETFRRTPSAGRKFSGAASMVAFIVGTLAWLAGVSGVLGLFDRARGGIDVVVFLAVLLGFQWVILLGALPAWLFRRRAGDGFSVVQALIGRVVRKLSGNDPDGWWHRIMDGGPAPRAALLWRIARLAQGAGILLNVGIICGLGGLVMVRHVGFFWETTTESAMRDTLVNIVHFLSAPWSGIWREAVPDVAAVESSRWLPDRGGVLPPGPTAWWLFLLACVFVWGLLPRLILWVVADRLSKRALASIDFQARHHRSLWRELTGVDRAENLEKPLDGVLVLDVGGGGFLPDVLRPFLLQKLRVHPASWHTTAVLDPGAEDEAAAALALAPAGVVLLAEGWALSPARMSALHSKIRTVAGNTVPVKFLVANETGGSPVPAAAEEMAQWGRFVDSLRDPHAEVYFYA